MMKLCPVCDRPARDLIRLEDILICERCADSVDVEPALQNLDAAEWKDPSRSRSGRTAVGAAVPDARRWGRWAAAGSAAAVLAVVLLASLSTQAPLRPSPAAARIPVATPNLAEMEPPAPPPAPARPETGAERVRRILEETRPRVLRIAAPRRGGTVDVDVLLREARSAERSLREAEFLEPGNAELRRLQGRLYAGLGRYDEALAALGRGAKGDQAVHLDRLEVVLTAHLMLKHDEAAYPSVVRALRLRLAARHGGPLEEPAGALRTAFAYAVSGDFAEARDVIDDSVEKALPESRRAEVPFVRAMLEYLEPSGTAAGFRPLVRPTARTALAAPEIPIWLAEIRRGARRGPRRPGGTAVPAAGAPVHGATLRRQAADREQAGDLKGALERLDQALLAQPRNVPLRLERARILSRLGARERAVEAYEAAAGVAATLGLPEDAIREISALKRA